MKSTVKNAGGGIKLLAGLALVVIFSIAMKTPSGRQPFTYLALGDSYTIGESVPSVENFPNQTVRLLRKDGHQFTDPAIIAETGWTCSDLASAIKKATLLPRYDYVTLLIGVNNQYQNLEFKNFVKEFEVLLSKAIRFAGSDPSHVFVLSIPDWSVTPYAGKALPDRFGREAADVEKQIGEYNAACKLIAGKHHVTFIDITPDTRKAAEEPDRLASDGLHPSPREYAGWAEKLATQIQRKL